MQKNKHHIMPIITPAFPSMCSTHNVSKSTKTVLLAELTRASKIVDKIMLGTATWRELFEEHNFFSLYKHYIRIGVYSSTPEDQLQWQVHLLFSYISHFVQVDFTICFNTVRYSIGVAELNPEYDDWSQRLKPYLSS
jgi:poly(A) polymerase